MDKELEELKDITQLLDKMCNDEEFRKAYMESHPITLKEKELIDYANALIRTRKNGRGKNE